MARQRSIIKLEGTIGDISFFKTKDGFLAREKTGVNSDRVLTDPRFIRTRENGQEFGRAGRAGKLFRVSIKSLLKGTADGRITSRLMAVFMQVIKADLTSVRGQRNVIDGEAELLEGFDFNLNCKLDTTLTAPFSAIIDRALGELKITVPPFAPLDAVASPAGSTHFKLVSAGTAIDFENGSYESVLGETAQLPLNALPTAEIVLSHAVSANSTHPLFVVLGIVFYQEVNGTMYPLTNGNFNSLAVVKVSGA